MAAAADARQLIDKHLSLVQGIARKVKRSVGASSRSTTSSAMVRRGWSKRPSAIDGRAGVAFTTFAYYRIRGAMYDGLRTMGWTRGPTTPLPHGSAPTSSSARTPAGGGRARRGAGGRAAARLGRQGRGAGPSRGAPRRHRHRAHPAAGRGRDGRGREPPRPHASVDTERLSGCVREAITTLPPKERKLMELYYFADKTLEEAGAELGSPNPGLAASTPARSPCCARRCPTCWADIDKPPAGSRTSTFTAVRDDRIRDAAGDGGDHQTDEGDPGLTCVI